MSTSELLFRFWPYAAVVLWAVGLAVRYLRALPRMEVVTADLSESWSTFGSSKLLRGSLAALALAHALALVSPATILAWNGRPDRLYILEGLGFLIGLVALGGWLRVVWRHLSTKHPSKLADLGDSVFVSLVLVGLGSGLATAALYRWASSWSAVTVMPYMTSLLSGQPVTAYPAGLPFLAQLHVCAGFGVLAAFPLTRLAPFLVVAIHRVLVVGSRPVAAVGRAAEGWFRRHNPGAWIWPKED